MQLHDNLIFLLGDAEARRRAVAVGYGAEEVAEFRHHEGEPDTALGLGSISSRRCSNKPLVPQVRAVLGVPLRVACRERRTTPRVRRAQAATGRRDHEGPARPTVHKRRRVRLATSGRDTGTPAIAADHDNGWYDTGDLAIPDGRAGSDKWVLTASAVRS
jgi:hypothetical protein